MSRADRIARRANSPKQSKFCRYCRERVPGSKQASHKAAHLAEIEARKNAAGA